MGIWIIEGLAFAGIVWLMAWVAWRQRHPAPLEDDKAPEDATDGDPPGA